MTAMCPQRVGGRNEAFTAFYSVSEAGARTRQTDRASARRLVNFDPLLMQDPSSLVSIIMQTQNANARKALLTESTQAIRKTQENYADQK